jgi:hypothetical protein
MRKAYPSDIRREQFEVIQPLLEGVRKTTKPRTVDLYEVFCGVLYLLKSGCQRRMLASDFPKLKSGEGLAAPEECVIDLCYCKNRLNNLMLLSTMPF